jgi:hypothetical protein
MSKACHGFQCSINVRGTYVEMGGEADASFSTLGSNPNLFFPKSILQFPSGVPSHRKGGYGGSHARIGGGRKAGFGEMCQSFPQAFGQHGIPAQKGKFQCERTFG